MSEHPDSLSPWWWPGAWLRIVYGVWVDQRWYWRHVRPRLGWHPEGWGLFAQAALGTALITASFVAPVIWAVGPEDRPEMLLGAGLSAIAVVLLSGVGGLVGGIATGLAGCVAATPVVVLVLSLGAALGPHGGWRALVRTESAALAALVGLAVGLAGGCVRGICDGITSGEPRRTRQVALDAALSSVLATSCIARGLAAYAAALAAAIVALLAGYWLGAHWSTRQLDRGEVR